MLFTKKDFLWIFALFLLIVTITYGNKKNNLTTNFLESYSRKSNIETSTETEVEMPENGHVIRYSKEERLAPFKVETPPGTISYYVILKDAKTKETKLGMFVHPNSSAETTIPLGKYLLYTASGEKWHGFKNYFGSSTFYTKSDTVLDFHFDGKQYMGNIVKLEQQIDGNMNRRPTSKRDFD